MSSALNKMKIQAFKEVRKTNPKFKYSQMNKIKDTNALLELLDKYNISLDTIQYMTYHNVPKKIINRDTLKSLIRKLDLPVQTTDEFIK
jgi:hypothetical protein